jgi:hypothetical protein
MLVLEMKTQPVHLLEYLNVELSVDDHWSAAPHTDRFLLWLVGHL